MLPVIKLGMDPDFSDSFMEILQDRCSRHGIRYRVEYSNEDLTSERAIEKAIDRTDGICLYVIVMTDGQIPARTISHLGRLIMGQNRDNYILYILPGSERIQRLLPFCVRPFGVLVMPPEREAIEAAMDSVLTDYANLVGEDAEDTEDTLVLQDGGVFYRIPTREIVMIEALNKKLLIHYGGEVLSVYASMAALAEKLSRDFFQCHRSYLVNRKQIQRADMSQLVLYLKNGQMIPVARSRRSEMKNLIRETGEAAEA